MLIQTRRNESLAGVQVKTEGGVISDAEEVGCPLGTAVEVRDLFSIFLLV